MSGQKSVEDRAAEGLLVRRIADCMKGTILFLVSTFCALTVVGQSTSIVVPNNLADVEGNSSASEPFNSTSFRFQQVFDASQFAIPLGASGRINGLSFRMDGAATEQMLLFFGGSSWTFSTTTRSPDSLSPVFADNTGPDAVTVFNGAFSFSGNPPQPGMPGEFNPAMLATSEFWYQPSQGNLLLDVIAGSGQAFFPGALDAHSMTGDAVSWVWVNDAGATVGTAESLGLVTRFDITIVPEPAPLFLLLTGLGVLAAFKRK